MDFTGTFKPVNIGTMVIYQGANFRKRFVWTINDEGSDVRIPVGLTNATISAQVRRSPFSPLLLDFTPHIYITNPVAGEFELALSATDTSLLSFDSGVFQLEVEFSFPEEFTVRLLEGFVELSREIVR